MNIDKNELAGHISRMMSSLPDGIVPVCIICKSKTGTQVIPIVPTIPVSMIRDVVQHTSLLFDTQQPEVQRVGFVKNQN